MILRYKNRKKEYPWYIASGSWGGYLRLWDLRNSCVLDQSGVKGRVGDIAWNHNNDTIFALAADNTIQIWGADHAQALETIRNSLEQ